MHTPPELDDLTICAADMVGAWELARQTFRRPHVEAVIDFRRELLTMQRARPDASPEQTALVRSSLSLVMADPLMTRALKAHRLAWQDD